jgi:hypothetical protein
MGPDADPMLRRVERTAAVVCLVMAAVALVLSKGDLRAPLGVLGGGLLVAISYRTIGSGVSGIVELITRPRVEGDRDPAPPRVGPGVGKTAALVTGRYALLAVLAYVMIARLRMHPIGLLAGASSVVAAAAVEALRLITKKS